MNEPTVTRTCGSDVAWSGWPAAPTGLMLRVLTLSVQRQRRPCSRYLARPTDGAATEADSDQG